MNVYLMMEFILFLFSVTVQFISKIKGEQIDRPVININGCCSSQEQNVNCDEQNKKLLTNITKLLNEHEKKLLDNLGKFDFFSKVRDCQDIQRQGYSTTGVYNIYPEGTVGFPVRCDMDITNGGWTVIQRRTHASEFYKTWTEYQIGFGNVSDNHWLGNQQIHSISRQGWYELRVNLVSLDGEAAYAEYNVFLVGDIDSGYKLSVDGYSGNAGDSLARHNGQKFSTHDKDNDIWPNNCAQSFTGAWWYKDCHDSNLNGVYGATEFKGPRWKGFKDKEPMKKTEMMIRRWRPSNIDLL